MPLCKCSRASTGPRAPLYYLHPNSQVYHQEPSDHFFTCWCLGQLLKKLLRGNEPIPPAVPLNRLKVYKIIAATKLKGHLSPLPPQRGLTPLATPNQHFQVYDHPLSSPLKLEGVLWPLAIPTNNLVWCRETTPNSPNNITKVIDFPYHTTNIPF